MDNNKATFVLLLLWMTSFLLMEEIVAFTTTRVPAAAYSTTTTSLGPTASNGLFYEDLIVGDGPSPSFGDSVSIHYKGTYYACENNKEEPIEFENSRESKVNRGVVGATEGMPIIFPVGKGKVIEGWEQGILGNGDIPPMRVGGRRTLRIPAALAYGDEGRGGIPGNQDIEFDLELIGIGVETESLISRAFKLSVPGIFLFLILNSIYLVLTGQG
mmetsp:Transcript_8216/g.11939  ORF Transcript_8216/g.11939 Transcript_8216/m.11939 type:complete len:215 (-) Transcript_8216:209-853(-)|eukprot:CAMPEP_0194202700 /NCGR_PEP_ID=MMETSP0156-20130528/2664_1 /TAXON_ID=33649 /ORGANISM="Thalassionema nitzschioides, Strain L26-B" /LENGTH=214 /DNA_ID=CAMNT_0038928275 /DNA_START=185 /DNA_END=829 /DNA_ORIENTATION=+